MHLDQALTFLTIYQSKCVPEIGRCFAGVVAVPAQVMRSLASMGILAFPTLAFSPENHETKSLSREHSEEVTCSMVKRER